LKITKGQSESVSRRTTQWSKEQHNGQKKKYNDKQRSTKHTYKPKNRVTRTPLNTGAELRWSWRVSSSCSTSDTRRVNLVTNSVITHERGKDREVFTTSCHPVVLPNKFAFEENKLINLGRVVSMTVFLYFVNSLNCFFFIYHSRYGFSFVSL